MESKSSSKDSSYARGLIDDASPLAIFFVKSGSNGDRLLFRYPYEMESKLCESSSSSDELGGKHKNPYALVIPEDCINRVHRGGSSVSRQQSVANAVTELFPTIPTEAVCSTTVDPHFKSVIRMSDSVMSNLFTVKPELCGQKFELKINDVRFVGHPLLVSAKSEFDDESFNHLGDSVNKEKDNVLSSFNIVFALKANASHDIVNCFHDCSKRIAIALHFEEKRVGYLSAETGQMLLLHDEVASMPEDSELSPYRLILEKSHLANDLKKTYQSLRVSGIVYLRINRWIEVSFCMPQKVHRLALKYHQSKPEIGPQEIQSCLECLRPYHAVLLLEDPKDLLASLPRDVSPAFVKIISVVSPIKNLLELSADSTIALPHVFHIVSQLIYWGKVAVIFPLCENNIYMVYPLAPTALDSEVVRKFSEDFNGAHLLQVVSYFSLGTSLCNLRSTIYSEEQQKQLVRQVVWMLKHRLLLQLHTYVYLVSPARSALGMNSSFSQRPASSIGFTEAEQMEFSTGTGSSFQSEVNSLATSPVNSSAGFLNQASSNGESEEDLGSHQISYVEEAAVGMLSDAGFTTAESESILRIPASRNLEDLKLFLKLYPYFNGRHHLEDIMYYENMKRSSLCALIDKFKDILFTCRHEDAAIAQLCAYKL